MPLLYFTGRVDSSKITSVAVTIGAKSTTRQPIHPVPGEGDGYYVVFVPPLTFQDQESMGITGYGRGPCSGTSRHEYADGSRPLTATQRGLRPTRLT